MFSPGVLGYLKEKRVRNDKVFYTCRQSLEKEDATSTVEQGYVMKNDPFRKQMLVSSKEVLIVKGKLLDEQIEDIDVRTISYFQLQPERLRPETAERIKKSVSLSDHQPDYDTEDHDYIFQAPHKKAKTIKLKSLKGGPRDPFRSTLDARADLVCVPIATGVVMKSKSQKSSFSDLNLRLKFNIDL